MFCADFKHRSVRYAPKNAPVSPTLAPLILSPKKPTGESGDARPHLGAGPHMPLPEQRVTVGGLKPEVDATEWLIAKTTHAATGTPMFRSR